MSDRGRDNEPSKLNVDALFSDSDDGPESSAAVTTARASVALTGGKPAAPASGTNHSPKPSPREKWISAPPVEPMRAVRPPQVSYLDLDKEAQLSATSTEPLRRESLPPGVSLRAVGTPAPPMAVPSLRPPAAAPPPVRASAPPPSWVPPFPGIQAHPSPGRAALPEAAPAPPRPGVPRQAASPFQARAPTGAPPHSANTFAPAPSSPQAAAPPTDPASLTLPGLAPPVPDAAPVGAGDASEPAPLPIAPEPPSATAAGGNATPPHPMAPPANAGFVQQPPAPAIPAADNRRPEAPSSPRLTPPEELPHAKPAATRWAVWGAVLLGLGAVVAFLVLRAPAPGVLVISVSGPSSGAVPKLRVFVDGQERCTYSPCRVEQLAAGAHTIRAEAPDYVASKEQSLGLRSGTDTIHNLVLVEARKMASLEITAQGSGVRVLVDGKDLGAPPIRLTEITPGEHIVRIEGERFEPLDQTISLDPNEMRVLGPLKPKVKTGSLTIEAGTGADGATVTLNGKSLGALPVTLDVDGQKPHELVANKVGFDPFEHTVKFADGEAELSVNVALLEIYEEESDAENTLAEEALSASADSKSNAKPKAMASLSMNSIPPSMVLLDGQSLGSTPRIGVSTNPGHHVVTFVHPKRGRKTVKVLLQGGQSRTVSVRF